MWNTLSLPWFSNPEVFVVIVRVPSMSQIELFYHLIRIIIIIIISYLGLYSCVQIFQVRYEYLINKIISVR